MLRPRNLLLLCALAASAFTVTETFQTQRIEHAFLEPESSLAVPSGVSGAAHENRSSTPIRCV